MNKTNIPKLRFKEFSDEWQEKKLGNVGSCYNGLTGKCADDFGEGSPFITYMQIFGNSKIDISKFAQVKISSSENQNTVKQGDIFFTTSSETPEEVGFSSAILDKVDKNLYLNSFCFGYRLNDQAETVPDFFRYLFRNQSFRKILNRLAQGSTRFNLSKNELMKVKISIPIFKEQTKIAGFLTAVDEKINKLDAKKKAFEKYKKGVMQAIFSQKIRFKKSDGTHYPDWEENKLGEVAAITKGEQLNKSELIVTAKYPAVSGGIEPSGYTSDWNVEAETIIISEGGNSCGYVGFMTERFWCGGHCYAIQEIKSKIIKLFLYQILKFNELSIKRLRVGSGLPNIQKNDLSKFQLLMPGLEEQGKIATFLTSLDNKVDLINKELEQAKLFKKALLQQMFV